MDVKILPPRSPVKPNTLNRSYMQLNGNFEVHQQEGRFESITPDEKNTRHWVE